MTRTVIIATIILVVVCMISFIGVSEARLREGECEGKNHQHKAAVHQQNFAYLSTRIVQCSNAHAFGYVYPCLVYVCFFLVCSSVCLKRMKDFHDQLSDLKSEEAIHNGI